RLRKAVVIVTHDIAEAGKLAGDIVLMDGGRIIQRGPLRDLLLRPANEKVRQFLGRQAESVALQALRLGDVLQDVPPVPPRPDALALSSDLRLGQVLIALANVGDGVTVVDGDASRAYAAEALRDRVLADLRQIVTPSGDVHE